MGFHTNCYESQCIVPSKDILSKLIRSYKILLTRSQSWSFLGYLAESCKQYLQMYCLQKVQGIGFHTSCYPVQCLVLSKDLLSNLIEVYNILLTKFQSWNFLRYVAESRNILEDLTRHFQQGFFTSHKLQSWNIILRIKCDIITKSKIRSYICQGGHYLEASLHQQSYCAWILS